MKTTKRAEKIKKNIQDYIRCYQENKRINPPYLALSDKQLEGLGLYGSSGFIFNHPWRRHP